MSNRIHPYFVQTSRAVVASSEGRVYTGDLPGGHWVDAAHLHPGDRLLNDDATWAEVVAVGVEARPLTAYNLTVADFHTYFVAANTNAAPVWVHNAPCGIFGSAKAATEAAAALGYAKTKAYPFYSHGQPVYKNGSRYITPDADGHSPGVWKVFDRRGRRIGTADANLNIIKD